MALRPGKRIALVGAFASAGLLVWAAAFDVPAGPRSLRAFDPQRTASLELQMWQAYYHKEKLKLFGLLIVMLREQYRYPWTKAVRAGFHLARAAATFGDARSGYESVLPDLEAAYTIARDWTSAGFDPAAVARAELDWWVARRTPGRNSPENVGQLIGRLYALMYEEPLDRVAQAGLLRAQAAALRDRGGDAADWASVGRLLDQSYGALHAAVQPGAHS